MKDSKTNWWKIAVIIIVAVALFLGGLFLGKSFVKEKTEVNTEYIELPPVHDSIYINRPIKEFPPIDTVDVIRKCIRSGKFTHLFPKRDSIIYITKRDTINLIKDWATIRKYSQELFNVDTLGKCIVNLDVQYNTLQHMDYIYTPVQKQTESITKYKPKYSPFVGVHVSTNPGVGAQAGLYINNWGGTITYQYGWETKKHDVGLGILYKFN